MNTFYLINVLVVVSRNFGHTEANPPHNTYGFNWPTPLCTVKCHYNFYVVLPEQRLITINFAVTLTTPLPAIGSPLFRRRKAVLFTSYKYWRCIFFFGILLLRFGQIRVEKQNKHYTLLIIKNTRRDYTESTRR